jgi:hypothetical protein
LEHWNHERMVLMANPNVFLFYISIFHYSNIPLFPTRSTEQNVVRTPINLMGYRISEVCKERR